MPLPSQTDHCLFPQICDKSMQCENWLINMEGCEVVKLRMDKVRPNTGKHVVTFDKTNLRSTVSAPVIPSEQAPLYVAALNAFWETIYQSYPSAKDVVLPQDIASGFESSAAAVVEAWIGAYSAGGFGSEDYGGE